MLITKNTKKQTFKFHIFDRLTPYVLPFRDMKFSFLMIHILFSGFYMQNCHTTIMKSS